MNLGRTSLLHFFTQVLKSLAGFFTTLIIARLLGPSTLGVFAMAISVSVILTIPTRTVTGSMSKRISERKEPSAYFTAGTIVVLAFIFVISSGLLVTTPLVNRYFGEPVVGLLVLVVAGTSLFDIYTSILTGEKKVLASGIINTLEQIFRLVFQAALIVAGYRLTGLFVGKILAVGAATLIGIVISDMTIVRPNRKHFRRLYDFSKYLWVNQLKGRSFSWMDVFILGFFVESTLVGIYEVSWTLASTLILVSLSVQQTLFPEISELGVTEDYERVRHLVNEALVFVGIFGIPGFFGALVIGGELLTIYRPVFERGYVILLLLITARLLDAYASQLLNVIAGLDYPDINARVSGLFTLVNVSLNLLLVWQIGWLGAALATTTATLVELVLSYRYLEEIIGEVVIPIREIGAQILVSIAMAAIVYVLTWFVPLNNYTAVGLVFFGATVYVVLLLAVSTRIRRKAWMLAPRLNPENVG